MSSPRQPVNAGLHGSNNNRPSTSVQNQNAALTGAARAFINGLPHDELVRYVNGHSSQPPPKPKLYQRQSAERQNSDESIRSNRSRQDVAINHQPSLGGAGRHRLMVPNTRQTLAQSPSSIAAAQAATRASPAAVSVSPPDIRMRKTRSPEQSIRSRAGSSATVRSVERPDESSIPATTSLVKLFEQKDVQTNMANKPPVVSSKPATLQSPKPVRKSILLRDDLPPLFPSSSKQAVHAHPAAKGLVKGDELKRDHEDSDSNDSFRSAKEIASPIKVSKPPLPLPRRKNAEGRGLVNPSTQQQQQAADHSVHEPSRGVAVRPGIQLHPPTRDIISTVPIDIRRPSNSRASSVHGLPNSHPSIAATYHQLYPRRMTPLTTGESLANAMVASSLASSRAPSPHKMPPQPVTRHKSGSISHSLFSRTPSPPKKGMRHTMRRWSSASSEEEDVPFAKHKKKKYIRKHPNKHNEGDRKRWRDAITERERKRYEGVWAANKGLHIFFTAEEQRYLDKHSDTDHAHLIHESVVEQVTDIVTRDIWSRSRLPADILEQVWDLVDTQSNGRLLKEEFVVGLWLVDQCLKGRKLPVKVTESVWSSVRFLHGLKVRKK